MNETKVILTSPLLLYLARPRGNEWVGGDSFNNVCLPGKKNRGKHSFIQSNVINIIKIKCGRKRIIITYRYSNFHKYFEAFFIYMRCKTHVRTSIHITKSKKPYFNLIFSCRLMDPIRTSMMQGKHTTYSSRQALRRDSMSRQHTLTPTTTIMTSFSMETAKSL